MLAFEILIMYLQIMPDNLYYAILSICYDFPLILYIVSSHQVGAGWLEGPHPRDNVIVNLLKESQFF